jgi:PAS domain S-box-containing protein
MFRIDSLYKWTPEEHLVAETVASEGWMNKRDRVSMGRPTRRQLEKAEELSVLLRAVESTNEGFVTVDEGHKVIFFNRAAEKLFGYRREEVVGGDLEVILAPDCSQDHRRAVERYLRSRRPRAIGHAKELVARRKDGSTFPCSISFSVARRKGKVFFTGIVRDQSHTKRLQEQVVQAERLAALGQTVAEISHEIRNPMVVIGGFVRQLIKITRDPKALSKLEIMASEVQRVENLLLELKDLYLPRTLRRRRFDLNRMLEEVHALAKEASRGKSIRLRLATPDGPSFTRGDREKLKQVLLNVVQNSVEAMDEGGDIDIRSSVRGDRILVTISDDGPGIPQEFLPRVFTPFFTTKKEGTGLGLCISKRIIDEHKDSTLQLTTEEGRGTTVKIGLPLRRQPIKKTSAGKGSRPLRRAGDQG